MSWLWAIFTVGVINMRFNTNCLLLPYSLDLRRCLPSQHWRHSPGQLWSKRQALMLRKNILHTSYVILSHPFTPFLLYFSPNDTSIACSSQHYWLFTILPQVLYQAFSTHYLYWSKPLHKVITDNNPIWQTEKLGSVTCSRSHSMCPNQDSYLDVRMKSPNALTSYTIMQWQHLGNSKTYTNKNLFFSFIRTFYKCIPWFAIVGNLQLIRRYAIFTKLTECLGGKEILFQCPKSRVLVQLSHDSDVHI